jgi:MYXO-CTERM domain-containing protein
MSLRRLAALPALASVLALATPQTAAAFCGFYVSGADTKLYNNATQVVLMREGQRTVLSMQNNYQGPPQDFAMVVPVPVVLQKDDVKTLPKAVFDRVDQLAAPRLVEYWEQDPCPAPMPVYDEMAAAGGAPSSMVQKSARAEERDYGVKIEAKFEVGEYQVLILSAQDSTGLDTWLRVNKYKIPAGAGEVLRPYVQAGMKFFVAKVDSKKVQFTPQGQAMLSPLRFHYDSDTFALPVRLGLLNAQGKQDLIVHVVARNQRYEAANYRNVAIPSNLEVSDATRRNFPGFYAALFDQTLARSPGAVVTEYAWATGSCDPCPTPPLDPSELMVLGADVMPSLGGYPNPGEFVLTRLHARYGAETLGEDIVFRAAQPIVGGREGGGPGQNEVGAVLSSFNNFQARYIIRHPWEGPIKCKNPQRGIWGGPPNGGEPPAIAARDLAFVPRNASLRTYLKVKMFEVPALPGEVAKVDPYPRPIAGGGGGTPDNGGSGGAPDNGGSGGGAVDNGGSGGGVIDGGNGGSGGSDNALPTLVPPTQSGGCGRCDVAPGEGLAGAGLLALGLLGLRRRRVRG